MSDDETEDLILADTEAMAAIKTLRDRGYSGHNVGQVMELLDKTDRFIGNVVTEMKRVTGAGRIIAAGQVSSCPLLGREATG